MVKTTVSLPDELHRELKLAAKERGISEVELICIALRHELSGTPPGRAEREDRRARLLAAVGSLDRKTYPPGYLGGLRAEWRD
jgi:metal-responsive CopG/Arc/MetJ family transcriptional regulator